MHPSTAPALLPGPAPDPACGEPAESLQQAEPPRPEPVEGPPPTPPTPPPTRFSADERDDLQVVHDAASCSVRRDLLVELGLAAARGEPVESIHVAALAARAGIDQNTASHHLKPLRDAGYVRGRRQGRHTFYTAVAARVRVNRGPEGLSVTLIHASGAYVTYGVPMSPPPPAVEPPQVIDHPQAAEPVGGQTEARDVA